MKLEVLNYLMSHYGVTEKRGIELLAKHFMKVADAQRWASQPYYPAYQIASAEEIPHLEHCPGCEAEALADLSEKPES